MEAVDIHLDSDDSSFEESPPPQNTKNGKTAKLRKSCEACRSQKARCLVTEGKSEGCQRCARHGTRCVFLAVKARPKRALTSKARVTEMEHKLDGLMAMLHAQKQSQGPTPDLTPPPSDLSRSIPLDPGRSSLPLPHMSVLRRDILSNPQQFNSFSLPTASANMDCDADVISRSIITFQQAEEYLRIFRSKNSYFPFVVVSNQMSLESLRREKPFLLLAILTFGSADSHKEITRVLDAELYQTLARRTIVQGEKSLDLLQGLLVYLAWYHFLFSPARQQIYQLSQTAIAMAMDLTIHRPQPPDTELSFNPIDFITPPIFEQRLRLQDAESKRTFLGTYYLTSAISYSMRRPSTLKYNQYIGECCSFFANSPSTEYDHILQYFVRMQHFQEEVNTAFDYDSLSEHQTSDCARVEILLGTFSRQLQQFQETFPPEIWNNPQIMLTFHTLRIYLHEVAFHTSPSSSTMGSTNTNSWYHSSIRPLTLLTCMQSCKSYLDHILAMPALTFLALGMPEHSRLVYALLVLGSFSVPLPNSSPALQNFREIANLQFYLDALTMKTDEIIKTGNSPGFIYHFNFLFKDRDEWHARNLFDDGVKGKCLTDIIREMHPNSMKPDHRPEMLMFDGLFGENGELSSTFSLPQTSEQWDELEGFRDMWNADIELGNGLILDGGL